ncbi:maestro heat-like repeat family member 5 [Trichosurus vulpecula]|uniref:maestro heat-like repeat family member 5 n=1 Tax=Trichosurus vulpecula TaxID=9337 RepID=UPI00186B49F6|nr:maestro heat-like repeat family member 5 [Trichosurus vulpecula]
MYLFRSSVSYFRQPSLQTYDSSSDLEIESPLISQPDLPSGSKTSSRLSQLWPHKVLPHYPEESRMVLLSNTRSSVTCGSGCCWARCFRRARWSQVDPELVKIGVFIEEARNAGETICFKILKSLGMKRCYQVKASMLKLCSMAQNHQGIVLTTIQQYLQEHEEVGEMSAHSLTEKTWREELNREINKYECGYPGQSAEKTCLYVYYGVVLRASNNAGVVKEHLSTLLGTSHKRASQREGIAITIGLAATRHFTITCAVLEEFGKTIIQGKTPISKIDQYLEDIHWKWASSTVLLCYGHVASRTRDNILTLADSIASRIVCYFHCSHWKLIEKEPRDILCTSALQDAMLAVVGLSKLNPPLEVQEKSELLYTCFQSVFTLPMVEYLEKHTCLMMNPPNIQNLYRQTIHALDQVLQGILSENPDPGEAHYILEQMVIWMNSKLSHVRQRAMRSSTIFLKFIVEQFNFKSKMKFTRIGCMAGMLGMLCGDPDKDTRQQAMESIFYLYTILLRQKGLHREAEAKLKEKRRMEFCHSNKSCASPTINFLSSSSQIVKTFGDHFDISQLRDFMLTIVDGLHCPIRSRAQTAAEMLCKISECYGKRFKEVTEIGKRIYLQLSLIQTMAVKKTVLWAICLLVSHHTQELVFAFLEFSMSMNRDIIELWRAVGSNPRSCPKVLHFLLQKLEYRPSLEESSQLKEAYLESLAAMNILYEIIFVPEYQDALKTAFPQFLFSMVTQIHYIFELNLQDKDYTYIGKDFTILPSMNTSPSCTSVEAVKSLLSKNDLWQEFAYLELQDAWAQLVAPKSFCQGVCMLARAMVEYSCPHIPGIMRHCISMFHNKEERQRTVAMIFFTEFLRSPLISKMLTQRTIFAHLRKGMRDPSLVVQVVTFHCFSSIICSPEKASLLQAQLPALLDALYDPREKVIIASLCTMSNVLYQLGKQSVDPFSVDIALSLRPFFDDEREIVRGSAIYVFGMLVGIMQDKGSLLLKDQICRSLVPLLFRLMDQEEDVVRKAKFAFFRCASFLNWADPKKLFHQIAWEEGLQALNVIWKCLMENMFFKIDLFLSQALGYVHSKEWSMRSAAALYIGHTIAMLPREVAMMLDEAGMILLCQTFNKLKEDEDEFIRNVAAAHFTSLRRVARLMPGAEPEKEGGAEKLAPGWPSSASPPGAGVKSANLMRGRTHVAPASAATRGPGLIPAWTHQERTAPEELRWPPPPPAPPAPGHSQRT